MWLALAGARKAETVASSRGRIWIGREVETAFCDEKTAVGDEDCCREWEFEPR